MKREFSNLEMGLIVFFAFFGFFDLLFRLFEFLFL